MSLPFSIPLVVAFDTDDTLIIPACATGLDTDTPNYETIAVYKWFQAQGNHMIIWSGGGADYAKLWAERLGLVANEYLAKDTRLKEKIDIAFDDSLIDLAKVNVRVQRVANDVSRRKWLADKGLTVEEHNKQKFDTL